MLEPCCLFSLLLLFAPLVIFLVSDSRKMGRELSAIGTPRRRRFLTICTSLYLAACASFVIWYIGKHLYVQGTWPELFTAKVPGWLALVLVIAAFGFACYSASPKRYPAAGRGYRGAVIAVALLMFGVVTIDVGNTPDGPEPLNTLWVANSLTSIGKALESYSRANPGAALPARLQDLVAGGYLQEGNIESRLKGDVIRMDYPGVRALMPRAIHYIGGAATGGAPRRILAYEWFDVPVKFIGAPPDWTRPQVLFSDLKVESLTRDELAARLKEQGVAPPTAP